MSTTITVYGDTPQETAEVMRLLSSPAVVNNVSEPSVTPELIRDEVISVLVDLKEHGVFDLPTN